MESAAELTRQEVLIQWSRLLQNVQSLETSLKENLKKKKELEKKFRFLGQIKGILKKTRTPLEVESEDGEIKPMEASFSEPASKRRRGNRSLGSEEFTEEDQVLYRKRKNLGNELVQKAKRGKRVNLEEAKALVELSLDSKVPLSTAEDAALKSGGIGSDAISALLTRSYPERKERTSKDGSGELFVDANGAQFLRESDL